MLSALFTEADIDAQDMMSHANTAERFIDATACLATEYLYSYTAERAPQTAAQMAKDSGTLRYIGQAASENNRLPHTIVVEYLQTHSVLRRVSVAETQENVFTTMMRLADHVTSRLGTATLTKERMSTWVAQQRARLAWVTDVPALEALITDLVTKFGEQPAQANQPPPPPDGLDFWATVGDLTEEPEASGNAASTNGSNAAGSNAAGTSTARPPASNEDAYGEGVGVKINGVTLEELLGNRALHIRWLGQLVTFMVANGGDPIDGRIAGSSADPLSFQIQLNDGTQRWINASNASACVVFRASLDQLRSQNGQRPESEILGASTAKNKANQSKDGLPNIRTTLKAYGKEQWSSLKDCTCEAAC
jgi:hypothetical protein